MYDAQGGEVSVRGPSYTMSLSGGNLSGAFIGGAKLVKKTRQASFILGDDFIRFDLPTDVFDAGHYVIAQGAGIHATPNNADIFAFVGGTSNMYSSPFFEGARAQQTAALLFFKKNWSSQWSFHSDTFVSQKTTMIESSSWTPKPRMSMAIAGGIGADEPYGAVSLNVSRRKIDLKAAYIAAGTQFHRALVQTPLFSEPDRGNILVTVRPASFLSLTGAHQDFLTPLAASSVANVRSTLDEAGAIFRFLDTSLSATLFHSTYLQSANNAVAYSASRSFTPHLQIMESYLESRPQGNTSTQSYITNVTENVNPHWGLTQLISNSNGQTTVSFGGNFFTNFLSINADYQTYYVPSQTQNPFEEALLLDVQMHLSGKVTLHGATFVDPQGKLRYTTDANGLLVRGGGLQATPQNRNFGRDSVYGQVVDTRGEPIDGAALMLDSLAIYSDSQGKFFVRERKPHTHQFRVLTGEFLNGGNYKVIAAPAQVRSSPQVELPGVLVVVQRITSTETTSNGSTE